MILNVCMVYGQSYPLGSIYLEFTEHNENDMRGILLLFFVSRGDIGDALLYVGRLIMEL